MHFITQLVSYCLDILFPTFLLLCVNGTKTQPHFACIHDGVLSCVCRTIAESNWSMRDWNTVWINNFSIVVREGAHPPLIEHSQCLANLISLKNIRLSYFNLMFMLLLRWIFFICSWIFICVFILRYVYVSPSSGPKLFLLNFCNLPTK